MNFGNLKVIQLQVLYYYNLSTYVKANQTIFLDQWNFTCVDKVVLCKLKGFFSCKYWSQNEINVNREEASTKYWIREFSEKQSIDQSPCCDRVLVVLGSKFCRQIEWWPRWGDPTVNLWALTRDLPSCCRWPASIWSQWEPEEASAASFLDGATQELVVFACFSWGQQLPTSDKWAPVWIGPNSQLFATVAWEELSVHAVSEFSIKTASEEQTCGEFG